MHPLHISSDFETDSLALLVKYEHIGRHNLVVSVLHRASWRTLLGKFREQVLSNIHAKLWTLQTWSFLCAWKHLYGLVDSIPDLRPQGYRFGVESLSEAKRHLIAQSPS